MNTIAKVTAGCKPLLQKCNGCGACVRACPPGIVGLVSSKAAIIYDFCQQCGECFEACPVEGAIIFKLAPGAP